MFVDHLTRRAVGTCYHIACRSKERHKRSAQSIGDMHRPAIVGEQQSALLNQSRQLAQRSEPCKIDDARGQAATDLLHHRYAGRIAEVEQIKIGIFQQLFGHLAEPLGQPAFGRAVGGARMDPHQCGARGDAAIAQQLLRLLHLLISEEEARLAVREGNAKRRQQHLVGDHQMLIFQIVGKWYGMGE